MPSRNFIHFSAIILCCDWQEIILGQVKIECISVYVYGNVAGHQAFLAVATKLPHAVFCFYFAFEQMKKYSSER